MRIHPAADYGCSVNRASLRLGIQLTKFEPAGASPRTLLDRHVELARAAEAAGFDTFWVMDYLIGLDGQRGPDAWLPEGNMLLAAIAAGTERIDLGLLVAGVTFRNPAWHAKATTTLDVLSGGRAVHGVGAAWHEPEHRAYGFAFPPLSERLERLEEALAIARAMFTQEAPTFEGKHYRIAGARNDPRPLRGDIPILVGGSGERKTLRFVAQYADASNFSARPEQLRHLNGVIDRHCEAIGRDPAEIARTVLGIVIIAGTHEEARRRRDAHRADTSVPPDRYDDVVIWGAPDEVAAKVQTLVGAGATGFIATLPDPFDLDAVDLAGGALAPLLVRSA